MYREEKPDRLLSAPPNKPASTSSGVLTSPPRFANECKTFDELKTYWAENYNVKVVASVTELNFESVRAALEGVESVLKEFPQAGMNLREIGTLDAGIMCTSNGYRKINFSPKYFTNPARLAKELESDYYIKKHERVRRGSSRGRALD